MNKMENISGNELYIYYFQFLGLLYFFEVKKISPAEKYFQQEMV